MTHRRFITLEGGEGTGKSTQARHLAERLRQETGREVVLTREPGGTEGAEAIRALLVNGRGDRWSATAEALLNYAARDDHLRRIIVPALDRGAFVVCDRFADSTRAYQGAAGRADPALLTALEHSVVGAYWPDLTLVLDIEPSLGLARAVARQGGEGRFEGMDLAYHQMLRSAFLAAAKADPARCVVIDAAAPLEAVGATIWQAVASRLLA